MLLNLILLLLIYRVNHCLFKLILVILCFLLLLLLLLNAFSLNVKLFLKFLIIRICKNILNKRPFFIIFMTHLCEKIFKLLTNGLCAWEVDVSKNFHYHNFPCCHLKHCFVDHDCCRIYIDIGIVFTPNEYLRCNVKRGSYLCLLHLKLWID